MPDRFYHPGPWGEACELEGPEAHHLMHVLRAQAGTAVELFDGKGSRACGHVESLTRRSARIRVDKVHPPAPVPPTEIALAVAPPKGDRLRWLVEKLTELGVDRLIPLATQHSVVVPSEVKLQKLEQTVIAACKQSGRDRLLLVDELCPLAQLPQRWSAQPPAIYFGSRDSRSAFPAILNVSSAAGNLLLVIGPEGGLTESEENQLREWGGTGVSAGPHILRVETAAVALAACAIAAMRFQS